MAVSTSWKVAGGARRSPSSRRTAGGPRRPRSTRWSSPRQTRAAPRVRGGLALALHATRGPSPASELHAIEGILGADGAGGEGATIKQVAGQTGISVQTVRRRLKL